jgi:chromosome transmission fidelity protein 1
MIRQLGLTLLNICSVVPDGVVVFFPSHGYLDEVVAAWQTHEPTATTAAQSTLWDRLETKKAVFRETKAGVSEDVLQQYSDAILSPAAPPPPLAGSQPAAPKQRRPGGALLLSVVGGKLSEGINFSDRLGRCVVVVGLPYPNINSPDWKARLEYIEATTLARLMEPGEREGEGGNGGAPARGEAEARAQAKQAARDFYENACMRAVNQSIGRAIRHRADYAAVVLVDRRFATERIRGKLPGWIRAGMEEGAGGLQGLLGGLSKFFRGKQDVLST